MTQAWHLYESSLCIHLNYNINDKERKKLCVLGRKQYYWIIHLQIKGDTCFFKKNAMSTWNMKQVLKMFFSFRFPSSNTDYLALNTRMRMFILSIWFTGQQTSVIISRTALSWICSFLHNSGFFSDIHSHDYSRSVYFSWIYCQQGPMSGQHIHWVGSKCVHFVFQLGPNCSSQPTCSTLKCM